MRSPATLAASLLISSSWARSAQQTSFQLNSPGSGSSDDRPSKIPSAFAETIVSALSSSSQHTTLLHLLQRSKSIPLLAHIGNATLFAPTDEAWSTWSDAHRPSGPNELVSGWLGPSGLEEWMRDEEDVLRSRLEDGGDEVDVKTKLDNQHWALRQHLLYHMLNYTLSPSAFHASSVNRNISTETTLLFPIAEEPEHPPIPGPGSPWLPKGGEGMLGGHGQRLRLARAGSDVGGERGRVGIDWNGEGGVGVWDGGGWGLAGNSTGTGSARLKGARWVRNGVVVGIEGVLDMPKSIDEIIHAHPSLSYLSNLLTLSEPLPDPLPDSLTTTPHLTIFAPSNDAFINAFDDIEMRYLEGGYGSEGVGRIVAGGVVLGIGKDEVGWQDAWGKKGHEVESVSGEGLLVEAPSKGTLRVNGTEAEAVDIFASNGVIHILPSLLLPENFTLLNSAEKVLLSLNATRFVSLLRSANLSTTYVGGFASDAWTILAPTDDVLDMLGGWRARLPPLLPGLGYDAEASTTHDSGVILPAPTPNEPIDDVSPLQALLQYHILPGRLLPSDLKNGMLLGTERRTSALGAGRQRLRVDVSERLDRTHWENVGEGEIRFGGATVLGKPVSSGKSIIYLITNLLAPPDDFLQTAVSDLQLSTFVAAVYAADLDKAVKYTPATTYFVPRNRAIASLGLTMRYLLTPEGKDELRKVIRYHAIDGIVYSSDVEVGKRVYKTLEGGEVILSKTKGKNSTLGLSSPTKWDSHDSGESLPSNGELRPAIVTHYDALTETGAIHTIDSVILPADLSITVAKLIRGSKQNTMMDLMLRSGLGWVLEGREPTSDEVQRVALSGFIRTYDEEGDDDGSTADVLAMPSYTVLCPSDKAFSRLNLTMYLSDKEALLNLLKQHIVPSQPSTPRSVKAKMPAVPPQDGQPLSLGDDLVFSTLLSSTSKYGDIAVRATGDNSYIVGIRNARDGLGNDAARVGTAGRASVRWRKSRSPSSSLKKDPKDAEVSQDALWQGGMALGGGVVIIDSVLVPYEPSWFTRWGWLVLALVGTAVVLVVAAVTFGWWWMTKGRKEEGYEPLEGEEEDSLGRGLTSQPTSTSTPTDPFHLHHEEPRPCTPPPHPSQLSTPYPHDNDHPTSPTSPLRISTDSQIDGATAVNTPFAVTPRGSDHELYDLGKGEGPTRGLEKEMELQEKTSRGGEIGHSPPGVEEWREKVDLGNGVEEVIVIEWLPNDNENPFNWTTWHKYTITLVAVFITTCGAINCTSVAIMTTWGPAHFGVSREVFVLSFTVVLLAISFTPMVLAPLSEVFGRNIIYQVTSVLNALLFIPQATSRSFAGLLVARTFQGAAMSVGNSMVGGTVADLFHADERGLAMNVFSFMIFLGQALGGILMGWIGKYWGIQWCYGVQGILGAFSCVLNALILRETRGDVLLSRRAKRLTWETGKRHVTASELQKKDFLTLMRVSLIRPFQYLITEPIVSALSTWIGFAWAIIFLGGTSELLVFCQYGFNEGEAGSIQTVVLVGGILGFFSNLHQDHLYAKAAARHGGRAPPEARLYWAAYGGLLFPLATFAFAWTGRPGIPWPIPAILLCIANWGVYAMYSGIFNYLADAYETYSSSAQAAQSFARNIASAVFPLFAAQLYNGMGYPQASTFVASVALALQIAPILLIRYGATLRARSKVASALAKDR